MAWRIARASAHKWAIWASCAQAVESISLREGTEAASRVWLAGAGIVADSIPASEREETLNKARGLLRALEMAETQL